MGVPLQIKCGDDAQTGGTRSALPGSASGPMVCFPVSLLDSPHSTPDRLMRNSEPWNSFPSWWLPGESLTHQRRGLS